MDVLLSYYAEWKILCFSLAERLQFPEDYQFDHSYGSPARRILASRSSLCRPVAILPILLRPELQLPERHG